MTDVRIISRRSFANSQPRPVRAVRLLAAAAFVMAVSPQLARAWVIPAHAPPQPRCPAIPDADDVRLTAAEMARIEAGEIIVRIGEMGDLARRVWAAGYLSANPVWLFDVGTDSRLATDLLDILEQVDVLEQREHGKVMRGVADVSALLPSFEYTLDVSYLEDETGQCWAQIEGDFRRNEGSHAYLWDPVRGQTLAVLSFDLSLKGVLSLIPKDLVRRLSGRTLPEYMRRLERFAARLQKEDPERADGVERRWNALRERLEADALPGRVWRGPRSPELTMATPVRVETSAED